jgi:hypothetical protein
MSQSEVIPQAVVKAYSNREHADLSLEQSIQFLLVASKVFERSFIVVDALDEHIRGYEEENVFRMKLVEDLLRLQVTADNPGGYSLLFTSRDYLTIQEQLQPCRKIEIRAQEADIRSYLESRISRNPLLDSRVKKDPAFGDKMLDAMVSNAKGM